MLPSVKFAEDMVLVFVIFRENSATLICATFIVNVVRRSASIVRWALNYRYIYR